MWWCINLMIMLAVSVPLVYSQAVVIGTTKADDKYCEQPYTLRCTITGSPCCTGTSIRVWRKNNVQIMSDGAELNTSGKYSEYISNAENYFTLTINNIDDEDFLQDYVCSYSFFTSNTLTLNKDDFQCYPCSKCVIEKCTPFAVYGLLIGVFLHCLFFSFGFCCCKSLFYSRSCCCSKHDSAHVRNKSDAANSGVYLRLYGKEYEKGKMKMLKPLCMSILWTFLAFLGYVAVLLLPIGINCKTCYERTEPAFITLGLVIFIFTVVHFWTLKYDDTFPNWQYGLYLVLTALIVPIPFLVLYEKYHKGGKKTSTPV